jgi:hypothetical protein
MTSRILPTIAVLALGVLAAMPALAAVPTVADFAACNMKAAEEAAADRASASPRTESTPQAGKLPPDARPTLQQRDPSGATISSDKNPQVDGMAADRAKDPAYVAAYRSCMRQRGF